MIAVTAPVLATVIGGVALVAIAYDVGYRIGYTSFSGLPAEQKHYAYGQITGDVVLVALSIATGYVTSKVVPIPGGRGNPNARSETTIQSGKGAQGEGQPGGGKSGGGKPTETPGGKQPGASKSPVENPAGGSGKCPTSTEVTPEGITQIKQHLNNTPGTEPGEPESAMIARLESGSRTPQDITFYQHELIESGFVKQGLSPREAHLKALETQGIPYDPLSQAKIYHPDVIRQYPEYFNLPTKESVK